MYLIIDEFGDAYKAEKLSDAILVSYNNGTLRIIDMNTTTELTCEPNTRPDIPGAWDTIHPWPHDTSRAKE